MAIVKIEATWEEQLKNELEKPYFKNIIRHLKEEKEAGKVIYPPDQLIFNAFKKTPWDDLKVVILGQDPYHNPEEAMGLCFSVPIDKRIPPSLKNIFREIKEDIGNEIPIHGDLSAWADQGVFLLNAMLTVEHKTPGSHKKIGWQDFTNAIIQHISDHKEGIVFLLWGNFAKNKAQFIDESKHLILEAAHPSPLAGGKFFGCRHFSKTNAYLDQQGLNPIDWQT